MTVNFFEFHHLDFFWQASKTLWFLFHSFLRKETGCLRLTSSVHCSYFLPCSNYKELSYQGKQRLIILRYIFESLHFNSYVSVMPQSRASIACAVDPYCTPVYWLIDWLIVSIYSLSLQIIVHKCTVYAALMK